jgi:MinD-like ATPase involved in chromosome partitioning or flagellar assembly
VGERHDGSRAAGERTAVLVAAGGGAWEAQALGLLNAPGSGLVVLKRCVDLPDLLATASTGQARVAVVDGALTGLDTTSVASLRRGGVSVVLVGSTTLDADQRVDAARLDELAAAVRAAEEGAALAGELDEPSLSESPGAGTAFDAGGNDSAAAPRSEPGRMIAVWGPTGAPGRTTVAVGLAAELASRGAGTMLLDADPFGGSVAQHLGMLDEMSGLLASARLANAGGLDAGRLAGLAREVTGLRVLTGLPRADRWSEVRDAAFDDVLDRARALADTVVVDTGFCLEDDPQAAFTGAPRRHLMTLATLEQADEVVVVGSADPVGLARLARGLVELLETMPGLCVRVVVNRSRPSLGWGEKEVRAMIDGFVTPAGVHFLPEDRSTADRALVAGRSLVELGDSPLRRGLAGLADAVLAGTALADTALADTALAGAGDGRADGGGAMVAGARRRAARGRSRGRSRGRLRGRSWGRQRGRLSLRRGGTDR